MNYKTAGIKEIAFGNDLLSNLQDLIQSREALIVCDRNTSPFLPSSLKGEKNLRGVILSGNVKPYEATIRQLVGHTMDRELIIALGSGTITDICKYLAFLTQKEFIIFPTAPSVNAYTSPTASIIPIGETKKNSSKAKMPLKIYVDYTILKKAPPRMILSGLYDLICSRTVRVDCLIASVVLKQTYSEKIFERLLPYEEILLKHSNLLVKGDISLVEILMRALNLSGLGMWLNGDSRSASQAEHILAHLSEEIHGNRFLHGEMVAAGTVIISLLQERLFKNEKNKVRLSTRMINRYQKLKGFHFLTLGELTEVLSELSKLSSLLSALVSNHAQLRNRIITIAKNLPKIYGSFLEALSFKRNFTCLDVAYLIEQHAGILQRENE